MTIRNQNLNLPITQEVSFLVTGGLVAAFTGTNDDAVLSFTGAAVLVGPTGAITSTNSATLGTTVGITLAGVYEAELGGTLGASAGCVMGISQDMEAAGLTIAPVFGTAGVLDVLAATAPAATVIPFKLTTTFLVTSALAGQTGTPAGSIIRFLGTDAAGAAPAGLTLASWYARIRRVGDLAA